MDKTGTLTANALQLYRVQSIGDVDLATAQQQYARAATLFGLADQMHRHVHYAVAGPMRALAEAALTLVRAALEPAVFAEAFTTGQQMTLNEAFATVLVPAGGAGLRNAA